MENNITTLDELKNLQNERIRELISNWNQLNSEEQEQERRTNPELKKIINSNKRLKKTFVKCCPNYKISLSYSENSINDNTKLSQASDDNKNVNDGAKLPQASTIGTNDATKLPQASTTRTNDASKLPQASSNQTNDTISQSSKTSTRNDQILVIDHDHVDKCSSCIQARERCSSCRWKCKCGKKFSTKNSWRNHLKNAKDIAPRSDRKKDVTLLTPEYISQIILKQCCSQHCLKSWTYNEVSSFVRKNANISNDERKKKVLNILELMEKKEKNNLSSCTIGGIEFNIVLNGKTICGTSFIALYGISYNTCKKLVENYIATKIDDFPENEVASDEETDNSLLEGDHVSQKEKINTFYTS
jgi:hypothetical protein